MTFHSLSQFLWFRNSGQEWEFSLGVSRVIVIGEGQKPLGAARTLSPRSLWVDRMGLPYSMAACRQLDRLHGTVETIPESKEEAA